MTSTSYTAEVTGIAWSGHEASTEYKFDHKPTRAEIVARSGDFQQITDVLLTVTHTTTTRVVIGY